MGQQKTIPFTSDDILGKDAIDPEGGILGVIIKLHIDKPSKTITGITIDQGFLKPNLFIGIDYIKHFGIDTVLLNKVPTDTYYGLEVLTNSGRNIGRVQDIIFHKNKIKTLIVTVKKPFKTIEVRISASDIVEIGANVIVKDKEYN